MLATFAALAILAPPAPLTGKRLPSGLPADTLLLQGESQAGFTDPSEYYDSYRADLTSTSMAYHDEDSDEV